MDHADPTIRFVWSTDSHIVNSEDDRDAALRKAVADCNKWRPNAFIHTGDIGDNNSDRVLRGIYVLQNCQRPVYTCIGNHDEHEPSSAGSPDTDSISGWNGFGEQPFYHSKVMTAGDGSWSALCLFLDCNYYDDDPSQTIADSSNHSPGDRIGYHTSSPSGGYYRRFGPTQLQWIEDTLSADTTSDIVLVFCHYPPVGQTCTDYAILVDKLQADGRPSIGFCGHSHPSGQPVTISSTDSLLDLIMHKAPAMQESFGWVRVVLGFVAPNIDIQEMAVQNYLELDGWSLDPPFEKERQSIHGITAVDTGANGLDGTYNNVLATSKGAWFNGVDSYIDIYSLVLNTLFNPAAGSVILRGRVSPLSSWGDGVSRHAIKLGADSSSNQITIRAHNSVSGRILNRYEAGNVFQESQDNNIENWFTAGLTWSVLADEVKGFINGAQVDSTDTDLATWVGSLTSTRNVIGASVNTGASGWHGYLSNVILSFGVVATAAQIADINTKLIAGTLVAADLNLIFGLGLWAWWKLDEGLLS